LCVGLLNGGRLTGWPLAGAASLCFVGSIYVGALIGMGTVDPALVAVTAPTGNPVGFLIGVVTTAMVTFGIVGAVLGGLTGGHLDHVAAEHLKQHTA
jgi:hypothetical protein